MPSSIIDFWFNQTTPKQWWQKDPEFDAIIKQRFGNLHRQASAGELHSWRRDAQGALAEIIILDQFSRNLFRDQAAAFANDTMALTLSQVAIEKGFDQALVPAQRLFLYMPYMHSESAHIHREAVPLFESLGLEHNLEYELQHKAIIDRFGRYPHRNALLNRPSTKQEIEFLQQPNSRF